MGGRNFTSALRIKLVREKLLFLHKPLVVAQGLLGGGMVFSAHTARSLKLKVILLQRLLPPALLEQQASIVKNAIKRVRVLIPQRAPPRSQCLKVKRLSLTQLVLGSQQIRQVVDGA